jgi:HlyD family secretion protein
MAHATTAPLVSEWHATDPWIKLGMRVAIWLVGGMFLVSLVFSISGAVVASGSVTVDGSYKSIQHLDGGIIASIDVQNGDRVRRGDVLIRLDDTQPRASLAIVMSRLRDQWMQQARLAAERDRKSSFALPEQVARYASDPQVIENFAAQKALFDARRASHQGEQDVLSKRLEQFKAELGGQETDLPSRQRQLDLAVKDLANVQPLFDKGFASQQRLGSLQREQARLEGEVGRLNADIARSKAAIAEAELKLLQSEKEYTQSIVDELRKVQQQITELEENRKTLADRLDRVVIRAPESGRIHALAVHTEGGVITPGKEILQIVPDEARLVVEAQVPPQDIDKVRTGQAAWVRFPAFNARATPRLSGTVSTVSAAELTNASNGRTYFSARVEVPPEELAKLPVGHQLVPGMPAEAYIGLESRSIMSYLLKPLTDALMRAFREK